MAKKTLEKLTVEWHKDSGRWVVLAGKMVIDYALSKRFAIEIATETADLRTYINLPTSVLIKTKNGRFQTEYTYPRSADPKKSKG